MTTLYRVTTTFTGAPGMPAYNTLYGDSGEQSASDFVTDIGDFWTWYSTNILANDVSFSVSGIVQTIDSTTGDANGTEDGGPDITGTGTRDEPLLPYATQMLVQLRTGTYFNGRELRGRIFLPGLTTFVNDEGAPSAVSLAAIAPKAELLAESALVVYSPTKHQWATVGPTAVWAQFASLRSRRD